MANKNVQKGQPVAEETLNKQEAFFLKNKKTIIIAVVAIILLIAGGLLYKNYVSAPREYKASTALAKSQQLFAQGEYDKALNGDSISKVGFRAIIDDYSGTYAANLAQLYAGLSYANLGSCDDAIKYLERFSTQNDAIISPAATAALGNAYAHLEQLDKAVSTLVKAAEKADNNSLSPTFLIQAGEILESQGKKDEALKLYKQVKEKYFQSMQYQTIDKYIERVSE
jgi:predicted negative regulator of RcsB-dependent stress response